MEWDCNDLKSIWGLRTGRVYSEWLRREGSTGTVTTCRRIARSRDGWEPSEMVQLTAQEKRWLLIQILRGGWQWWPWRGGDTIFFEKEQWKEKGRNLGRKRQWWNLQRNFYFIGWFSILARSSAEGWGLIRNKALRVVKETWNSCSEEGERTESRETSRILRILWTEILHYRLVLRLPHGNNGWHLLSASYQALS